jgi:hypothetical protein
MALRRDDLQGQRKSLVDEADEEGSGGEALESGTQSPETIVKPAGSKKKGPLSAITPCLMITALLFTFAVSVVIVLYVLSAAFDPDLPQKAIALNGTGH